MKLLKVTKSYSAEIPDNVTVYGGDYFGECNSEDSDLISFVSWIKFNYPYLANLVYHIPNEAMKPVQGIVTDKKKGVLNGAPDVYRLSSCRLHRDEKALREEITIQHKKPPALCKAA